MKYKIWRFYLSNTTDDKRLIIYSKCDLLTEEVVGLERQSDGHIQHPDGGRSGSKDMIDAVCGAVYNASFFADEFSYNYGESLNITTEVNSMLEGPNVDFEQVLMQRGQVVKDKENDSYLDFGNGKSQEYWTTINDGILLW